MWHELKEWTVIAGLLLGQFCLMLLGFVAALVGAVFIYVITWGIPLALIVIAIWVVKEMFT